MNLEIKDTLKEILGNHAYNNDMELKPYVSNLCRAVNYMVTQIKFTAQIEDAKEAREYADNIIKNCNDILLDKED